VIVAGLATPVIALVIYAMSCPDLARPCGGGGPGTCFGGIHWNCFNPLYVLLYSSIGALILIAAGIMIHGRDDTGELYYSGDEGPIGTNPTIQWRNPGTESQIWRN
jgi:hypothetical protein